MDFFDSDEDELFNNDKDDLEEIKKLKKLKLYTAIPKNMLHVDKQTYGVKVFSYFLHKFTFGLNVLNNKKKYENESDSDNIFSYGFKFTTIDNIGELLMHADYICSLTIPFDDPNFKIVKFSFNEVGKTNMIIIDEFYDLSDPNIYKTLNIPMLDIDIASSKGYVNILQWWKDNEYEKLLSLIDIKEDKYDDKDKYFYKKYGSTSAMDRASEAGQTEVLEWWKNSGLPLNYTNSAIDYASFMDVYASLDWWKNSGLPLKYTKNAFIIPSAQSEIKTLEWWKNSGLKIIYDDECIEIAIKNRHPEVVDWWIIYLFETNLVI